jgi:hypothetical protein
MHWYTRSLVLITVTIIVCIGTSAYLIFTSPSNKAIPSINDSNPPPAGREQSEDKAVLTFSQLGDISLILPPDVRLISYTLERDKASLQGTMYTMASANNLLKRLRFLFAHHIVSIEQLSHINTTNEVSFVIIITSHQPF